MKKSESNLLDELVKGARAEATEERKTGRGWTKDEPRRSARTTQGEEPERLNIDHIHTRGAPQEKWVVPEGKGQELRDISVIAKQFKHLNTTNDKAWLKQMHQLLFGRPGKKTTVKTHLLSFSGATSEHPISKIEEKLKTWLKEDIVRLANTFCLGGSKLKKGELIELVVKFCKKPKPPKEGTTPPPSPKKKSKKESSSPKKTPPTSPRKPKLTAAEKKAIEDKKAEKEYEEKAKAKSAREQRAEKGAAEREKKADKALAEKKEIEEKRAAGEPVEKYKYEKKDKAPKEKKEPKTKPKADLSDSPKRGRGRPRKTEKSETSESESPKKGKRKAAEEAKGSPSKKKKTEK